MERVIFLDMTEIKEANDSSPAASILRLFLTTETGTSPLTKKAHDSIDDQPYLFQAFFIDAVTS